MKYLSFLFILFCFCLSTNVSAQAEFVGDWKTMVPDQSKEGEMMPIHLTIKSDNLYMVDFGGDGKVEITGKYVSKGNQMIIQDVEGSECTGKGVYAYEVTADGLMMNRVSDECEGRGGPEGKMSFSRK